MFHSRPSRTVVEASVPKSSLSPQKSRHICKLVLTGTSNERCEILAAGGESGRAVPCASIGERRKNSPTFMPASPSHRRASQGKGIVCSQSAQELPDSPRKRLLMPHSDGFGSRDGRTITTYETASVTWKSTRSMGHFSGSAFEAQASPTYIPVWSWRRRIETTRS